MMHTCTVKVLKVSYYCREIIRIKEIIRRSKCMENLLITEKINDSFALLTVSGSINSYTYHEFERKVYDLIKEHSIVLDLSRVTNLSSSGLGILMAASEDGAELGHTIYIMNPSEVVNLAIASTGFAEAFPIIHSFDEIK